MKKYINVILIIAIIFFPFRVLSLTSDYVDKVAGITGTTIKKNIINIYLFRGEGCPHCAQEEKWLKKIEDDYNKHVKVYYFEVWKNEKNADFLKKVKKNLNTTIEGVPFTVIGDEYYVGYSDIIASKIENKIKSYANLDNNPNEINIPFIGVCNVKEISIPLVAVILGFIDGFNPCAMWILLFLINMLFGMKNKKKSWILGFWFLIVSGFVYFLSMNGINFVLSISAVSYLKFAVALFIFFAGILNLKKYFKTRKESVGCTVVDSSRRKKIISRVKKIISNKNFGLSMLGITMLATSVNLIELACSLGFPMIFVEILDLNNIKGALKVIYLLIYIFFYMIDDMVVFSISMITLEATGITNKYNKLCTFVSGIIMILMSLMLLFKPGWLMFNF